VKIRIKSETVFSQDKKGANGPYTVYWQEALFDGGDETLKVHVPVDSPSRGYPVGEYTFSSASFVRNKYQSLELGRLILEPVRGAGGQVPNK